MLKRKNRMLKRFVSMVSVLAIVMPGSLMAQQNLAPEIVAYADMVVYNGKVLLADDDFTIVEAIAVRDGKILAAGKSERIANMAGPNTRKIDLQGKSVTPGYINTHAHGFEGNVSKASNEKMVRFRTKEAGFATIKDFIANKEPGEFVYINAQRQHIAYTLDRDDLDALSPDNPLVVSMDNDTVTANSMALEMGGVTPDIPGSEKDPKTGKMNGRLHSFAGAKLMYEKPWPDVTEDLLLAELESQMTKGRGTSDGITLRVGRTQGLSVAILTELWKRGELRLRIRMAPEFLRNNPDGENFLRRIGTLQGFGDDWLKINGLSTQHPDGGNGGDGGRILTSVPKIKMKDTDPFGPYGQNRWALGLQLKTETDYANVVLAIKYGWDISSIHSMGDASHDLLMQAFKDGLEARGEFFLGDKKPRLTLDHNVVHSEETIKSMAELNVTPSVAVHYVFGEEIDREMLLFNYGADRVAGMVPVGSMVKAGIKPSIEWGPKAPDGKSSALWFMQTLVTRKDNNGKVWGADQKVDRKQALWMFTNWSAGYINEQDKLGTLETGKLADFVILDGDYMGVPEDDISKLKVLMTVIGGKVMYERPDTKL